MRVSPLIINGVAVRVISLVYGIPAVEVTARHVRTYPIVYSVSAHIPT
jgi:hypothetical protein